MAFQLRAGNLYLGRIYIAILLLPHLQAFTNILCPVNQGCYKA